MIKSTYNMRNNASAGLSWLILLSLAALLKSFHMAGGGHAHFTGLPLFLPLLGVAALPLSGAFGLLKFFMGTSYSLLSLVRLPTLCGGLYWAKDHWFIRAGIPALCIIMFLAHPVGLAGWGYAMLWLIPIALYCADALGSLFMTALGCTMTVHAVGSVLWLYTIPMTAELWWALIPVALGERIIFAAAMVLMYLVHLRLSSFIARILSSWIGSKESVVTT